MCRLVGWVSEAPRTLAELLGEAGLAELTDLSRLHADGWGIAWWEGDELRSLSSHLPAYSSAEYAAATRQVRSDAAVLHLRWATPGLAVAPENTHPFLAGDWAFAHNGSVRPPEGLSDLLAPGQVARLRGETDSERLFHVLLARVEEHGLDDGLRRTVADVCRDLTPSSLNALLLGREELTVLCCHGGPSQADAPALDAPPEDRPGYFDLRWQQLDGSVVAASDPLGSPDWRRLANGTALVVSRGRAEPRTVDVGTFPAAVLERERSRRQAATRSAP